MQQSGKLANLPLLIIGLALSACNANPPREPVCALPQGPDLEKAIHAARLDLAAGCEHRFDDYFQRLLTIAKGDPKNENKERFSDFLIWTNEQGLLSKQQVRKRYNRYFGVKYVSLMGDYSVCAQSCPKQAEIMSDMQRELQDKELGLLKISADQSGFVRTNRLFEETRLVLEAACSACDSKN